MTTRKTYPPWSEKELETLKELYPDNDNEYISLIESHSRERKDTRRMEWLPQIL